MQFSGGIDIGVLASRRSLINKGENYEKNRFLGFSAVRGGSGVRQSAEAQKPTSVVTGPDAGIALPLLKDPPNADDSTPRTIRQIADDHTPAEAFRLQVETPLPQSASGNGPGYTMSRHARLRVNRTIERLLLEDLMIRFLSRRITELCGQKDLSTPAVDRCNRAWLRTRQHIFR